MALLTAMLCSLGLIIAPLPADGILPIIVGNRLASLVAIAVVMTMGLCYLNQRINNARLQRDNTQTQQSWERARRWLGLITDTTQLGTWHYTLDSGQFDWSEEAAKLHGQNATQPPNIRHADRFYPKADAEKLQALFERCLTEGLDFGITVPITNAHGKARWIQHQGRALRNTEGVITEVMATVKDISPQFENDQRMSDIPGHLNALPLAIWTATSEGTPDFFNMAMSLYTGVPLGQLTEPGYWLRLVHPDDQDRCLQVWTQSVQTGKTYQIRFRIRRHDGAYCWHLVQAEPSRDAQGHITHWYGSAVELPPTYSPDDPSAKAP